jgi:cobaltochelatase CobT
MQQHNNGLVGLAMVLAKNNKIKVTISGENSYCDTTNKHINLARMDDTPLGRMLCTGLVMHETAHMNHTTTAKPSGMHGEMTNIIEDIRIEALTIAERPGTRFNLDAVTKHYVDKGELAPENLNHALCGKVMAYGRGRLLCQISMLPIEAACNEMIEDAFSGLFIDELEKIIKHIPKLKNTDQTIAMAGKIVDLILHPPTPPQPPPQPQNSQTDKQKDSDENDDGTPQEAAEKPNGGNEGDSEGEGNKEPSQDAAEPKQPGGKGAGGKPTKEELEELVNEESGYGDLSKLVHEEMDDLARSGHGAPLLPDLGQYQKRSKLNEVEAISASSRMRAKMIGLLESVKRKPTSFGLNGKKIVPSQLVKMATSGEAKIFSKKTEQFAANTAVVILCDYSGSMWGEREMVAKPATFALHTSLYGLRDVVCCSLGFQGDIRNGQDVAVLVGFERKPTSEMFNQKCDNGTPLAEGLWAARALLLERREPRKILLVLTDGEPNEFEPTRQAVKAIEAAGIDLAAIGIQSSAAKHYFSNSCEVDNLAELPAKLFSVMDAMLIKRRKL